MLTKGALENGESKDKFLSLKDHGAERKRLDSAGRKPLDW